MDLLGDVGNADQLASVRAENRVLTQKVKELQERNHALHVENQSLKAEVEMYREEAAMSSISRVKLSDGESKMDVDGGDAVGDCFIASGNGVYTNDPAVSLPKPHGSSNPLSCTLHPNDSLLATGGADSNLSLCSWGVALSPSETAAKDAVSQAAKISCHSPVICAAFAQENRGTALPIVAAGCMDGSVCLVHYGKGISSSSSSSSSDSLGARVLQPSSGLMKHSKYVKNVLWSPSAPVLASSSADGTVRLVRVLESPPEEKGTIETEISKTLHLSGTVESMCFLDGGDTLCCYVRGNNYLSYFDLKNDCKLSRVSLNSGNTIGGFDEHVSFAVMDLSPSPNGKFVAAATDTSRNIILEAGSSNQIRNLYGHKNDGYSQPKIGWSSNGQYIYGNTQEDSSICVWDIASSTIVKRLDESCGGHSRQIRDLYCSPYSDTVVTASYDKTVKVWLRGM